MTRANILAMCSTWLQVPRGDKLPLMVELKHVRCVLLGYTRP